MTTRYTFMLTLTIKHRYFSSGIFEPLGFVLAEETAKRLLNLGVVVKPFSGGVHLLCADPELLKDTNDLDSILIHFITNDSYYINYSDLLDFQPSEDVLYFNNLAPKAGPIEAEFALHQADFVGNRDKLSVNRGIVLLPASEPEAPYVFTDALGRELEDVIIEPSITRSESYRLKTHSTGFIQIRKGQEMVKQMYYQPQSLWKKPLGVLEIFTGRLFSQFSKLGKLDYVIEFDSRKTIWKYFLVDPMFQNFNHLSIINKDKEMVFSEPQKIIMQDREAWVLESLEPNPLKDNNQDPFKLVADFDPVSKNGKEVIKVLPNPSADQLHSIDTLTNYSHIYI